MPIRVIVSNRARPFGNSVKSSAGNCVSDSWGVRLRLNSSHSFLGGENSAHLEAKRCGCSPSHSVHGLHLPVFYFLAPFFVLTPCSNGERKKKWFHWVKLCSDCQGILWHQAGVFKWRNTVKNSPCLWGCIPLYSVPPPAWGVPNKLVISQHPGVIKQMERFMTCVEFQLDLLSEMEWEQNLFI